MYAMFMYDIHKKISMAQNGQQLLKRMVKRNFITQS
jgi:hypothetical protein